MICAKHISYENSVFFLYCPFISSSRAGSDHSCLSTKDKPPNITKMASKIVAKLVKPPISLFGLEGRYVNALYSAASKSNKLDTVEGDLKRVTALYKSDTKFREFMITPLINPIDKNHVFEKDLKAKLKLNELTVNFLSVMSDNRRLKKLPEIESAFNQIMSAVRNELKCTITTAKQLTDAKKKEIEDSLKAFTPKKLLISYEIDPSIMGGLLVDFNGEHYIDMSVKSKIRQFSECIKQA